MAAGSVLRIDVATVEAVGLLADEGIPSILLKGPSFARWLYSDPRDRPYADTDLLISPDDLGKARDVLARHGFTAPFKGAAHELIHYAEPWLRSSDGAEIDLHHRLPGIADSETAWRVLSSRTEPMSLRGHQVTILDAPARALHVTLHAAQHGSGRAPSVRDLERALEVLDDATWADAAALARATGAVAAFESGMRLAQGGAEVLGRLHVAGSGDSAWALAEILREEEPGEAMVQGLVWFGNVRGIRAKAALLAFKAFPPKAVLAAWSPLARRGVVGLVAARVWRPVWLVFRAPRAIARYRRARALQRARAGESEP
ncbi:MAG TPA: nucleotidyltransferase family protein [Actinomycetota bacterium]|nr:nucleotidyltransferase family protein [Actinomycetota bacterium]